MAQGFVQDSDAEGLANEPGMHVQHHNPAVGGAVLVHGVETFLEHQRITVHVYLAVGHGVNVIQFQHDGQGQDFALGDVKRVRLLVVCPIANVRYTGLG